MSNRMAIWTQNNKILYGIITFVFIYMMNAKDFYINRISTIVAPCNQISSHHIPSYIRRMGKRMFSFFIFCKTLRRAIYSFFCTIGRCFKLLVTVFAVQRNSSFFKLPLMITLAGTILRFAFPCCNVFEFLSTNYTVTYIPFVRRNTTAFMRAKLSSLESVSWNIKFFSTGKAIYYFSSFYFIHRTEVSLCL